MATTMIIEEDGWNVRSCVEFESEMGGMFEVALHLEHMLCSNVNVEICNIVEIFA